MLKNSVKENTNMQVIKSIKIGRFEITILSTGIILVKENPYIIKRKTVIYEFGAKREVERLVFAYRYLKASHHTLVVNPYEVVSGRTKLPELPRKVQETVTSLIQSLVK